MGGGEGVSEEEAKTLGGGLGGLGGSAGVGRIGRGGIMMRVAWPHVAAGMRMIFAALTRC